MEPDTSGCLELIMLAVFVVCWWAFGFAPALAICVMIFAICLMINAGD